MVNNNGKHRAHFQAEVLEIRALMLSELATDLLVSELRGPV